MAKLKAFKTQRVPGTALLITLLPIFLSLIGHTSSVNMKGRGEEESPVQTIDFKPQQAPEKVQKLGKTIIILKPTEPHDEHGFRPYRFFEENKIRKANNEFLYHYMQERDAKMKAEKEKKVSQLLKDALKTLKDPKSTSGAKTEPSEKQKKKKMLLQEILLKMEGQAEKEAKIVAKSKDTQLAKAQDISKVKQSILNWIDKGLEDGSVDVKTAASLTMFVENHDKMLNHHHLLAECPYRFLAKLVLTSVDEE